MEWEGRQFVYEAEMIGMILAVEILREEGREGTMSNQVITWSTSSIMIFEDFSQTTTAENW